MKLSYDEYRYSLIKHKIQCLKAILDFLNEQSNGGRRFSWHLKFTLRLTDKEGNERAKRTIRLDHSDSWFDVLDIINKSDLAFDFKLPGNTKTETIINSFHALLLHWAVLESKYPLTWECIIPICQVNVLSAPIRYEYIHLDQLNVPERINYLLDFYGSQVSPVKQFIKKKPELV